MADVEKQEHVRVNTVHQSSDTDGYILDASRLKVIFKTDRLHNPVEILKSPSTNLKAEKSHPFHHIGHSLLFDYSSASGAVALVPQAT